MDDREAWNRLRVDLYRRLLPHIQRMDQESGSFGQTVHWDDPDVAWDTADDVAAAIAMSWDAIGLSPIIQEVFYAIEEMEGEDLSVLESLDALTDPMSCPANLLPDIAGSYGYDLEEDISEDQKRAVVLGLQQAFKALGTRIGFKVWYRMIGFELVEVVPLWKKNINEDGGDYSQDRYATTAVTGRPVGPAGTQTFNGRISDAPLKPGTVRFTDGSVTLRSDAASDDLVGPAGSSGTIDHASGAFTFTLPAPAVGSVTADYERVDEEWPYRAARIDVEISLTPMGAPPPLVDAEVVDGILARLDECRPIHVILRVLTLASELEDDFTPAATDLYACTQMAIKTTEGVPSIPTSTGLKDIHVIDEALRGGDELAVQLLTGGGTLTFLEQVFDDLAAAICPLDLLAIDTGGASPVDGLW